MSQPYTLPYGPHTGYTIPDILESDPSYIEQCIKTAMLVYQSSSTSSNTVYQSNHTPIVISESQAIPIQTPCLVDVPTPQRTTYDDIRDLVFDVPFVPMESNCNTFTTTHYLYQLPPAYPSLTINTLCTQCGQPFTIHNGLSCPTPGT